jgi:peptidoglycan/xylan/chitin deacetylase (PgdA/CDA1 family)
MASGAPEWRRRNLFMRSTLVKTINAFMLAALAAGVASLASVQTILPADAPEAARNTRSMALTFDDLPYAYAAPAAAVDVARGKRATAALLRMLSSHHAPAAAFVNEAKLGNGPETKARTALLRRWVKAGVLLGNHTYSHADFNATSVQEFEAEILRGEVVTRRLMKPREPYQLYFRPPKTHTGDTREKKEAIEAFLAARGYKMAPHTIDSEDYVFNAGYVQLPGEDRPSAARWRSSYVDFVIRATEFAERVSREMFGRDIPQTILLHANDLNADALDELLTRLEGRGYRFVSLDAAMADPAYRIRDTFVTTFGPTWLWRWAKSEGMTIRFNDDPEPPQWAVDRFKAVER